MKTVTKKIFALSAILNITACGVSKITPEDRGQIVNGGDISSEAPGTGNGEMVLWENTDERPNPPDGIEFGIEFEFDLKRDQAAHLYLDSDQNYDCEGGTYLYGPSYFIILEDGTEMNFLYKNRSTAKKFPGKSEIDYPGLVPAGNHKLIARWYSDDVCNMDVSVQVKDRYAPENNRAYVQSYYLKGKWVNDSTNLKFSYDKMVLSETDKSGKITSAVEFKVFDFPSAEPPHLTRQVSSVLEGDSDYKKDQVEYCVYEIKGATYDKLNLACSKDGITLPPEKEILDEKVNQFIK